LGSRDLAVLESLREFRVMSGAQLRRLHFQGEHRDSMARRARAAMKRLTELDVVNRMPRRMGGVRAGSEGHLYSISGRGHTVLSLTDSRPSRYRRVDEVKPAFESHALAVAELAVRLHELRRSGHCELEALRAEPACWRSFAGIGGDRRVLKPDLFVQVVIDDVELSAFVEVDLGTESGPTLVRKLGVYLDYYRSGLEQREHGVFPRVWWVAPDAARLAAIRRAIECVPVEGRQLFATALAGEAADHLIRLGTDGAAR
ncbi:replication-relaxation family protein, partial [Amycolatopsis lurida]|uniref:replication-relaxation family protein n=1 Tax=Amycolatopsis lurida TaxID=31959 RepID=UPI0036610379